MFSTQLDHLEFLTFYFELMCIFRRLYLNKISQRADTAMIANLSARPGQKNRAGEALIRKLNVG